MFKFGLKADHFVVSAQFLKENILLEPLKLLLKVAHYFPIKSDQARYQLAECHHFVGSYNISLELLQPLNPQSSSSKVALLWLSTLLDLLKFDEFDNLSTALLAKTPNDPELLIKIANGHYIRGQFSKCTKLLKQIDGSPITNQLRDTTQARIHFYEGRPAMAASLVLDYLDNPASNFSRHYLNYFLLLCTGHTKQAMRLLRLRPRPMHPTALKDKPSAYDIGPLKGKTIYVSPEQGIGDRVEFARFFKRAADMGITLKTRQPRHLNRLFNSMRNAPHHGKYKLIPKEIDASVKMGDLPALLDVTDTEGMRSKPYLQAEPKLIDRWEQRVDRRKPVIGLAWKGSDLGCMDHNRSIPLSAFKPLLQRTDITVICLQIGNALKEIDTLDPNHNLIVFPDLDQGKDAYVDTAGLIMNLDLVVTSDTSMAHVAGALGAPSMVLLGRYPDLRWLQDARPDYLYQNQNLIRQETFGDWNTVVQKLNLFIDTKFL